MNKNHSGEDMQEVLGSEAKAQEEKSSGIPHVIGNIVGIALIVILLPIVVINMTLIIKGYTNPNKVPTFAGVAPLIVMSGSMDPEILVNDLIFTKETDAADLKERDVIAFLPPEESDSKMVVTHRIVRIETDENGQRRFITKGDFNNAEDAEPVLEYQLVGKYFFRIGGLGKIAEFLQEPVGMIVFVAIPLALFLLYDVIRRQLYNRKKKGEKDQVSEELERLRALEASLAQQNEDTPAAPAAPPQQEAYPRLEGEDSPPDEGSN